MVDVHWNQTNLIKLVTIGTTPKIAGCMNAAWMERKQKWSKADVPIWWIVKETVEWWWRKECFLLVVMAESCVPKEDQRGTQKEKYSGICSDT